MLKNRHKYSVEMYDGKTKTWKQEFRWYSAVQDVSKFTDNQSRRNFKKT